MPEFFINHFIPERNNIKLPAVQKTYAQVCSALNIFWNLLLFTAKLFCGLNSGSSALIADSFNNLTDAVTALASWAGFYLASAGSGETHRFGHGRYEWIMGLLLVLAIITVGSTLAGNSISALQAPQLIDFNSTFIVVLVGSILIKLYMYSYNKKTGTKINSATLQAVAADCRSDMAATAAVGLALIIEQLTVRPADGWCGLLVAVFIIISGLKSLLEISKRLLGTAADPQLEKTIQDCVHRYPHVESHDLTIHDYGLGHYAATMHLAGYDSAMLSASAQAITYQLYCLTGCELTIQTDQLINDPSLKQNIIEQITPLIHQFDDSAKLKNLRLVDAGTYTNIILTIVGSRKLQNQASHLKGALDNKIGMLVENGHVITKLLIAALTKEK